MPLSLAALCLLGVHRAAGVPVTKAGFLPAPGVRVGPATPGEQLWVRRYNGPANSGDVALALGVSPDGSKVFVTGSSFRSASIYDYATVAYDASTGAQLWVMRYDGPGNRIDGATALGVSADGPMVFVTGSASVGSTGSSDYATVAYSTT